MIIKLKLQQVNDSITVLLRKEDLIRTRYNKTRDVTRVYFVVTNNNPARSSLTLGLIFSINSSVAGPLCLLFLCRLDCDASPDLTPPDQSPMLVNSKRYILKSEKNIPCW